MIKLSIIIPVFNAEKTLRRCLDSVLQQKDDELEIVVINDGSKDSSDKIIKEYKEKNPQTISYYKKQNTGVADTRNYGIKKAFYDKYNVNEVLQENKLTPEQIAKEVEEVIKK